MDFTAVIVTHDSGPDLARVLSSLERWHSGRAQIVVVDTGSRDAGPELARTHGAEVVALDRDTGFGAANNAGVQRAQHDVTVLLNPDVEFVDDRLRLLVTLARMRDALLFPRLLHENGRPQDSAHPLPGRAREFLPALIHPRLLPPPLTEAAQPWRARDARPVGWAIAACLVARTATLRRLGPFDPDAFLFYEDLELCLRARAAGIESELHPEVVAVHRRGHATGPAFGGEPHALLARRRREVVRRHLGRRALALDDAAQAITFGRGILGRTLLGRDASRPRAQLAALREARRAPG
jgi:GT2 family glycosyltransferase